MAFYLVWYSIAAAIFAAAALLTRRWRDGWRAVGRIVLLTGIFSAGFTTVPLAGPAGSKWVPIGVYYLQAGAARWEAYTIATVTIGAAWFFLAVVSVAVWAFFRSLSVPESPDDGDLPPPSEG